MFIPAYSEESLIEPSLEVHQLIINKQNVIYPYSEIISAVTKEWITDTVAACVNLKINYTEWKKPDKKWVHNVWFHLYEILEKS